MEDKTWEYYIDSADACLGAADLAWDESKSRMADFFVQKAQAEALIGLLILQGKIVHATPQLLGTD